MNIVTIDGNAGVGKSTIARRIAKKLNYDYLDTGAMYRAFALYFVEKGIDINYAPSYTHIYNEINIDLSWEKIYLNSLDVTQRIREPDIDFASSKVSSFKEVREFLVEIQRKIGKKERIVAEGRDMGTVVFPLAKYKFFLTATPEIRAKRRYLQNLERGIETNFDELLKSIILRDEQDSQREHSPLKKADDAILIDTSYLSIDEVEEIILGKVLDGKANP